MRVAWVMASRGTCGRLNVGCVITKGTRIVSSGWNGSPTGLEHCASPHPDGACETACHAEMNAIAWAARIGLSTEGSWLFCTHQPCLKCSQIIVNAGISRVIWDQPYRDKTGILLLKKAGVEVIQDQEGT
ncbi:MAG: cytidine deaminase [Actinobacteria bacterium]|nr:cytidine deaminase [Actinomycetota bacterium]